jgi:hypothetical protein
MLGDCLEFKCYNFLGNVWMVFCGMKYLHDQHGGNDVLGTQNAWTLFLWKFWDHTMIILSIHLDFDEFFGGIK